MEKMREIAERYGLTLIYLFGTQAETGSRHLKGEAVTPDRFSDLDIAVQFKMLPEDIDIYGNLYIELSELFGPFDIDIVFIHEVDTFFCYEIISGIRVYEKSEKDADRFEEDVLKRAGDLYFKKKAFDKDAMEAIEDGYFPFEYHPNS